MSGFNRRPVMRAVQQLFLSGGEAEERELAAIARDGDVGSRFYAALYLSLYHESLGDQAAAEARMREAVDTDYARGGGRSEGAAPRFGDGRGAQGGGRGGEEGGQVEGLRDDDEHGRLDQLRWARASRAR